mgnify:CR=1 FL=1
MFELRTNHSLLNSRHSKTNINGVIEGHGLQRETKDTNQQGHIHLKGQMLFMEEWQAVAYLATPM